MTDDSRQRFIRALGRELRGRPLARRRILREIAAHVDDIVAELEVRGQPRDGAVDEALSRIGDVADIVSAFRECQPRRRLWSRVRSPAWIAVAALSLVTGWAAELPQASGAKATTRALTSTNSAQPARPGRSERTRRAERRRVPGAAWRWRSS